MAYKRTTQKFGNRRITTTYNNGKITRSESSAAKTKPGQRRMTTTLDANGKSRTTYTTNLGGGYYSTETSGGIEARRRKREKESREFWAWVFGMKKPTRRKKADSGVGKLALLAVGVFAVIVVMFGK